MFLIRTYKYHQALEKIERLKREFTALKDKLELQEQKAVAALEARLQRELVKKDAECQRTITDLKQKHSEELSSLRATLAEEHYSKLSDSMEELHAQGNATTKFMEKMVTNMTKAYGFSNSGTNTTRIEHTVDKGNE